MIGFISSQCRILGVAMIETSTVQINEQGAERGMTTQIWKKKIRLSAYFISHLLLGYTKHPLCSSCDTLHSLTDSRYGTPTSDLLGQG
jgi:hypothetical protein